MNQIGVAAQRHEVGGRLNNRAEEFASAVLGDANHGHAQAALR